MHDSPLPDAVIASVKSNISFLSLLKSYNIRVRRKGDAVLCCCPFHPDTNASFSIDTMKNLFHCFGCGAKGNVIQFVQEYEKLDFRKAVEKLLALSPSINPEEKMALRPDCSGQAVKRKKQPATSEVPNRATIPRRCSATVLKQAFSRMVDTYNERPEGKNYLEGKRGIRLEGIEAGYCTANFATRISLTQKKALLDIGLLTPSGRPHFSGCVVFPLRDIGGELTGLYGRKCSGEGHYYMKGERTGVFGLHDGTDETVIITESIIDAITVHNTGAGNVLALHGVNGYTASHEQWLKTHGITTVHLLLDADTAGREAAVRLSQRLKSDGYRTYTLQLPDGEDPNSFFSFAAHTLTDLRGLPGYPPQQENTLQVRRNGEELVITGKKITYTVRGLTGHGLDRMRVTIRAALSGDPSAFHIDNLDLYYARARGNFIEGLAGNLGCNKEALTIEVNGLLATLEQERLRLRDEQTSQQQKKAYEMSDGEKQQALSALKSRTLVQDILDDFDALGMVGEEKGKLLCYLAAVSRLLPHPLGVLIVSRSGAGKTTLQDTAGKFVPEEHLVKYTRLTGQALFYKDAESLKHHVLSIEEEEGMAQALYAVRTLQSSQRLKVATTRSDPKTGRLKTDEYTVEGPVAIFIATTNPDALDNETKNRFIILTIDESPEQTKRIMDHYRHSYTLAGKLETRDPSAVIGRQQNMQRLLKSIEVINNYAPYLDYAIDRLQMRREMRKYFTLIESIALLRQYQKTVKFYTRDGVEHRYIEVDIEDITIANDLAAEFFRNSLDELAPHTRTLADEIIALIKKKDGEVTFTRKELRDLCNWSDWSVRVGLSQLETLGYIVRKSGSNGVQIIYELIIDPTAEERSFLLLTAPDELGKQMKAAVKEKKVNGTPRRPDLVTPCESL